MKKYLSFLIISLFTIPFAQTQGGPNPEMRALIEPYTNLITSVGLMLELEKSSDLPISSEQAALLMPILTELETSAGYDGERAIELLDTMELDILTIDQLTWMDGEFLKRREAAQNGEGRGGFSGGFGGRPPGQGGQGQEGQGGQGQRGQGGGQGQRQGGPGGFFQRIIAGEPVNMFVENENAASVLDELIEMLSAKFE